MDGDGATSRSGAVHNTVSGAAEIGGPVFQAQVIESLTFTSGERRERPRPRQLPRPNGLFVNRTAELRVLTEALGSARLVSVSGLGGVGKTELIAQWGEEVAPRFPDGQLYADLEDERRDGAVDVSVLLGDFLTALGVARDDLPAARSGRAALFRSVTAGLRLLVVVDNVEHAPEVRPLLPGGGVLVALSRRRLPALVLDGAVQLTVEPLDDRAGVELVRHWQGTAAEPAAAELVRLCGGLPLALRAAGHQLLRRPHQSLEDVVRDLGGDGGWLRGADDEVSASVVFDQVVAGFPEHTRALYLLLGSLPCPTFTAASAAAVGAERFPEALEELLNAHLAVVHTAAREGLEPRFRLHDVVRVHAREYSRARTSRGQRAAALRRCADFYVEAAGHADRAVLGARFRLQPEPGGPSPFEEPGVALEWLDAERANLLSVVRQAAEEGRHDAVWRLCESLWSLYHSRKHYSDWIESHRLGVAAAQWEARPDAEIRMRNQLARAHYDLGEYEQAQAELAPAEELLPLVSDQRLHGVLWETRALVCRALGEHDRAVELFGRALLANEGDPHGTVVQSYQLGQALVSAGRPRRAVELLEERLADPAAGPPMRMRINLALAAAHRALRDADRAVASAVTAAVLAHRLKQYGKLAQALALTSELAEEVRDARLRRACLTKAEELRREMETPAPGGRGGAH
ncbi:tetratricopeptide repeat protein [Streptomyces sp. TP-A0874]|uniref:tetratricopeptide repeat protein n=1 Tax=Streptomyces sp. TP-A0874 TaxID=549819 RepID=UPI0009A081C9|nr:tetratricopeptide repeat protein [Streptomyces sp. TP-A0874]